MRLFTLFYSDGFPFNTALGIDTISKCLRNQSATEHPQGSAIGVSQGYKVVLTVVMRRPKCQALESQLFCLEALCP